MPSFKRWLMIYAACLTFSAGCSREANLDSQRDDEPPTRLKESARKDLLESMVLNAAERSNQKKKVTVSGSLPQDYLNSRNAIRGVFLKYISDQGIALGLDMLELPPNAELNDSVIGEGYIRIPIRANGGGSIFLITDDRTFKNFPDPGLKKFVEELQMTYQKGVKKTPEEPKEEKVKAAKFAGLNNIIGSAIKELKAEGVTLKKIPSSKIENYGGAEGIEIVGYCGVGPITIVKLKKGVEYRELKKGLGMSEEYCYLVDEKKSTGCVVLMAKWSDEKRLPRGSLDSLINAIRFLQYPPKLPPDGKYDTKLYDLSTPEGAVKSAFEALKRAIEEKKDYEMYLRINGESDDKESIKSLKERLSGRTGERIAEIFRGRKMRDCSVRLSNLSNMVPITGFDYLYTGEARFHFEICDEKGDVIYRDDAVLKKRKMKNEKDREEFHIYDELL